jgi:hypothetical protein
MMAQDMRDDGFMHTDLYAQLAVLRHKATELASVLPKKQWDDFIRFQEAIEDKTLADVMDIDHLSLANAPKVKRYIETAYTHIEAHKTMLKSQGLLEPLDFTNKDEEALQKSADAIVKVTPKSTLVRLFGSGFDAQNYDSVSVVLAVLAHKDLQKNDVYHRRVEHIAERIADNKEPYAEGAIVTTKNAILQEVVPDFLSHFESGREWMGLGHELELPELLSASIEQDIKLHSERIYQAKQMNQVIASLEPSDDLALLYAANIIVSEMAEEKMRGQGMSKQKSSLDALRQTLVRAIKKEATAQGIYESELEDTDKVKSTLDKLRKAKQDWTLSEDVVEASAQIYRNVIVGNHLDRRTDGVMRFVPPEVTQLLVSGDTQTLISASKLQRKIANPEAHSDLADAETLRTLKNVSNNLQVAYALQQAVKSEEKSTYLTPIQQADVIRWKNESAAGLRQTLSAIIPAGDTTFLNTVAAMHISYLEHSDRTRGLAKNMHGYSEVVNAYTGLRVAMENTALDLQPSRLVEAKNVIDHIKSIGKGGNQAGLEA